MTEMNREEVRRLIEEGEPVPEFPRGRIRAHLRDLLEPARVPAGAWWWTGLRYAAGVAAALIVFVAGVEYGRRLPGAEVIGPLPPASMGGANVSVDIQRRGTDYVASLARMTANHRAMTPEQIEEGKQVALAILYGAALELSGADPDDPFVRDLRRLLQARYEAGADETVWF